MNEILVYTDGACSRNGKKNSIGGMGVHFPSDNIEDISEKYDIKKRNIPPTNISTELLAIYLCIKKLINLGIKKTLVIVTDSLFSINVFVNYLNSWIINNKLKGKKNLKLIFLIRKIMTEYKEKILFIHVRGHKKEKRYDRIKYILGNEIADKLAVKAKFSNQ
jgi:ribonuclease HI